MDLLLPPLLRILSNLTLQDYLRSFYLLCAAAILLANSIPQLSTRFIPYGKTAQSQSSSTRGAPEDRNQNVTSTTNQPAHPKELPFIHSILDTLATIRVPHAYFTHFYILSVLSSLLWGWQIYTRGALLRFLLSLGRRDIDHAYHHHREHEPYQQQNQVLLMILQVWLPWTCLLLQGLRRLYEQIYIMRPSNSKMWILHYLVGIAFYLTTGMAIWADNDILLLLFPPTSHSSSFSTTTSTTLPSLLLPKLIPLLTFLASSLLQNSTHKHLASLKKYTLPDKSQNFLFGYSLCPHYFCEVIIYLSLAGIAGTSSIQEGITGKGNGNRNGSVIGIEAVNKTLLCAALFVAINLGVSAGNTYKWYLEKFGAEGVAGRWKMIPWIC